MHGLRPLVAAISLVAIASPSFAGTVVRAIDLAQLVALAPRIVLTEVVEVRVARADSSGEMPRTLVTVRVLETLKGTPALQLLLELPGGSLPRVTATVAGVPRFIPGQRDILFLHDRPAVFCPVVGVFAGRFRLAGGSAPAEAVVRAHDGRSLAEGPGADVSLADFKASIFRELHAAAQRARHLGDEEGPPSSPDLDTAGFASRLAPMPACLQVALGPSPLLADGCADWACEVRRAVAAIRPLPPEGRTPAVVESGTCASSASLGWATAIEGRSLDDLTLAVTIRRGGPAEAATTEIVLNQAQSWTGSGGRPHAAGTRADLAAVVTEVLEALVGPDTAGATAVTQPVAMEPSAQGELQALPLGKGGRRPSPRSTALAVGACAGRGGVFVNPRLLIFESPDHPRMTGYQVGFFGPRAKSAEAIIDVPLAAFLQRRAFDLPQGEVEAMQRSLVANIASTRLSTPAGRVFTYRVRGVWAGGTTAWSAPSGPVVRCPE